VFSSGDETLATRVLAMATYDLLRDLPVAIESYELHGLSQRFSPEFERLTTEIVLKGGGEEGRGEDVVYDGLDHIALRDAGPVLDLAGEHTLGSFAQLLDGLDLFPVAPSREDSRDYRRWAFESAALDLALRQAGRSLGDVLGREPRPLNYVVSMRLAPLGSEGPDKPDRLLSVLERYPGTRFKLDPTNSWTPELMQQLVETGAVDSLDLKGRYKGTPVDVDTDPELYRQVAELFPDAWLEDPDLDHPEAMAVLEPHRDRITWDAPIHSVADVEALPFPPKTVNVKPSRFGPLERLFAAYDYCEQHGIGAYGGGQSELGVGRDQIQYLAALMHPGTPNDTAPKEFNLPQPPDGLPTSPIDLPIAPTGFRLLD
jgi:L-alanine-DL-glutamate epimerase-like enolase superfamily enzyme